MIATPSYPVAHLALKVGFLLCRGDPQISTWREEINPLLGFKFPLSCVEESFSFPFVLTSIPSTHGGLKTSATFLIVFFEVPLFYCSVRSCTP